MMKMDLRKIGKINKIRIWVLPLPVVLLVVLIFGGVGFVGALNGWFGGGGSIPEDTMTRGLVGYWDLDEGSGTVAHDSSGYSNNGMLTNGPTWAGGRTGGALSFDGDNDFVNCGTSSSLTPPDKITMEVWLKFNGTGGHLVAKHDTNWATYWNGYFLYMNNDGAIDWRWSDGTWPYIQVYAPAGSVPTNVWSHIMVSYDGAIVKIYVNGNEVISQAETRTISAASSQALRLGWSSDTVGGLIDEVRIYNRALSKEEVRYHYNRGGPVAHWKFDEGEGRTVYDSTDNNNDGTLVLAGSATSSAWVAGKNGSALSFDGTDDYVSVPHSSSYTPTGAFSLSAWIKLDRTTGLQQIVSKHDDGPTTDRTFRFFANGTSLQFDVISSGVSAGIGRKATNSLVGDKWYHVVGVYDGGSANTSIKVYINGVQMDDTNTGWGTFAGIGSSSNLSLLIGAGRDTTMTYFFDGSIDDIRIYNYVRTPDEIRLDYNTGFAARFGPLSSCDDDPGACMTNGLIGYWDMEEGTGQSIHDSSGRSNNGVRGLNTTAEATDPSWTNGKVGGGLNFDGSDFVNVDNGNSSTTFAFNGIGMTLEVWFKTSSSGTAKRILGYDNIGGTNPRYMLSPYTGDLLSIYIHDGTNAVSAGGTSNIADGKWHHGVYVYDKGVNNLYVDGVLEFNAFQVLNSFTAQGGLTIGGYQFNDPSRAERMVGEIDEVRIYNRALSAMEVRYHYNGSGPVARWKFDEGSGTTIYDSTNNNNDCTMYYMSTSTGGGWTEGKYGTALSFDGLDDYTDCGSNEVLNASSSISVSAWVKIGEIGRYQRIVQKKYGAPQYANYVLEFLSTDKVRFRLGDGTNDHNFDSNSSLAVGNWYHLVGTYDGTSGKIYINGVLDSKKTDAFTIKKYTNNLNLGGIGTSDTFKGLIDEVSIYNYARTAQEVRNDYNAGLAAHFGPKTDCDTDPGACMTEGLVGYWDMEEGTGILTHDRSNNGNNGTLTSGPLWSSGIVPLSGGKSGGGALSLSSNYVNVGSAPAITGADTHTISLWAKFNTLSATQVLVANNISSPARGFTLEVGASQLVYFGHGNGVDAGGWQFAISANTLSVNRWYHLVGVFDGSKATIYINGQEDGTASGVTYTEYTGNVYIGRNNDGFTGVDGFVDEVRVYDRALSATEVRYHYNQGGPVGWWKMDEGEGRTVYDSTNNNNDGILILAGSATSSAWVEGKYDSALSFDGVDDYVSIPDNSSLDITGNLTMEGWVYFDKLLAWQGIISKANYSGGYTDSAYILKLDDQNRLTFGITSDGGEAGLHWTYQTGTVQSGRWYHIAVVFAPSTNMKIYIDGGLNTNDTTSIPALIYNSGQSFKIGKDVVSNYHPGKIDDVRIYNYARTPEQIRQDYNAGLSTHFK
ncbi:MAG: LamG domain-containing protein [Candidatus Omnitrophica bacterium]|nr:LamG domain-containing protein [Candidatus Omnitrophota bacterium]